MLFISKEDFYEKAASFAKLAREEEIKLAVLAKQGDSGAKMKLVCSYLPLAAFYAKKAPRELQTFELICRLTAELEKAAERFDFLQESESFSHRLGIIFRRTFASYIADADIGGVKL